MRRVLWPALTVLVLAFATALAGAAPVPASATEESARCVECFGPSCHVTAGPGATGCWVTGDGCVSWGDCA